MGQLVVLVRHRSWESETWYDYFTYSNESTPAETSMRNAVADYLSTKEGEEAIEQTSRDFNWGDAVMYVPDEIWIKYGFTPVEHNKQFSFVNTVEVKVDQDEVLC